MEESIYRMSLTESFLVLIIVGLWLFSIINLARKLERICNPPSIYHEYSLRTRTSLRRPSKLHERYSNDLKQPKGSSPTQLVRATSEPTIDASSRPTIHIRSPSETYLYAKSSTSEQVPSLSTLELERSTSSLNLPRHADYEIHVETISDKSIQPQQLINPRRIPSIVRRSLLDLHRRALTSTGSSNNSRAQSIVTTAEDQLLLTRNKYPLMKRTYQRAYTIDEDVC
jgi:hypothetical protein